MTCNECESSPTGERQRKRTFMLTMFASELKPFVNAGGRELSAETSPRYRFVQPVDDLTSPFLTEEGAIYHQPRRRMLSRLPPVRNGRATRRTSARARERESTTRTLPKFHLSRVSTGGHDGAVQVLRCEGVHQGGHHRSQRTPEEQGSAAGTLPALRSAREDSDEGAHAQSYR